MERLQFSKPDSADAANLHFLLDNAVDVAEGFRAHREAEAVKDEIQHLRQSPRTMGEAVETLQQTAAGTMERVNNWLRVCIHSVAKGQQPPTRRLDNEIGEILIAIFLDSLPELAEGMVELDDAVDKGTREGKLDTLQKKLTKLQNKVAKLVPDNFRGEDLSRSRLAELLNAWHHIQSLCDTPVDVFGTDLGNGDNPFAKIYDALGIGISIAARPRYAPNSYVNVSDFYNDYK